MLGVVVAPKALAAYMGLSKGEVEAVGVEDAAEVDEEEEEEEEEEGDGDVGAAAAEPPRCMMDCSALEATDATNGSAEKPPCSTRPKLATASTGFVGKPTPLRPVEPVYEPAAVLPLLKVLVTTERTPPKTNAPTLSTCRRNGMS